MDRESLWRQVVEAKYGSNWGGWCSKDNWDAYGLGVWKGIRKCWARFLTFLTYSVGNGERVKFWHDSWCGDSSLKRDFPELFSIVADKDTACG